MCPFEKVNTYGCDAPAGKYAEQKRAEYYSHAAAEKFNLVKGRCSAYRRETSNKNANTSALSVRMQAVCVQGCSFVAVAMLRCIAERAIPIGWLFPSLSLVEGRFRLEVNDIDIEGIGPVRHVPERHLFEGTLRPGGSLIKEGKDPAPFPPTCIVVGYP